MEIEHVFVAYEIDLDYEFDAARFFDFCRDETPAEASQAQLWFQTARSYPPSPFVTKLVGREDILLGNVNTSQKSKYLEYTSFLDDKNSIVPLGMEFSDSVIDNRGLKAVGGKISGLLGGYLQNGAKQPLQVTTGLTFCGMTISDSLNAKAKSAVQKSSTLMKPTASQLAKQKRPPQIVGSRFQKLLAQNRERNLSISSGIASQSAKRQKLEGGLLHKVADVKQQFNFVHKAPKKVVTVEQNSAHAVLKLIIPQEPDPETAHRAQRMRPKIAVEAENWTVAVPKFRARPLNRKILDAPSLPLPKRSMPQLPDFKEFHLKTMERAMQHTYASSSSSLHCNDTDKGLDKHSAISAPENRIRDLRRPSTMGALEHNGFDFAHYFKARPLNKKEFNFHTEKRVQHNPPIELFSKLSLTSELQPNKGPQLKLPRHATMDSKENMLQLFSSRAKGNENSTWE